MKLLLFSGLLYLAGTATILYFKPALMFRPDGTWKEFGIGRNPDDYTWMPLWMAAILWAIICYITVILLTDAFGSGGRQTEVYLDAEYPRQRRGGPVVRNSKRASSVANVDDGKMMEGYYILNTASAKRGVPRYVYVGEAPPTGIEIEGVGQDN
jgi:hypothetical protein